MEFREFDYKNKLQLDSCVFEYTQVVLRESFAVVDTVKQDLAILNEGEEFEKARLDLDLMTVEFFGEEGLYVVNLETRFAIKRGGSHERLYGWPIG